jgi:pyruvate,orthophosphate dikinase
MQRADFIGLFKAMDGLPVTIRLIDPPLHEFLPGRDELQKAVIELETRLRLKDGDVATLEAELDAKRRALESVQAMHEQNPMLGLRGVRLGIHMPNRAACRCARSSGGRACAREGVKLKPRS